jgi:hypothetical protein
VDAFQGRSVPSDIRSSAAICEDQPLNEGSD